MQSIVRLAMIPLLLIPAAAGAVTVQEQLLEPIRRLSDSFNKGDMKAAAATFSSRGLVIIDEVSPHIWEGPSAFDQYLRDNAAFEQAEGISGGAYKMGTPTRVETSAEDGYVALPVEYTFTKRGVPMRESARMVYVLRKEMGSWVISSFTWVGATAKPIARTAR